MVAKADGECYNGQRKMKRGLTMKSTDLYIAPRASAQALNAYYARCTAQRHEIQTLQIWQGDECLVRVAPAPYRCTDRREVYSLSKTFCSTAVGVLCDEGKLSVEDRIVDIFPDKLPPVVSENLAAMRVRHVLSMNTGHVRCVMPKMFRAEDAVRAFLDEEVVYEPGTHFAYNTGATYLLAQIVVRITGESLYDYLSRKILFPIGARDVAWNASHDGVNEGGIGIQVTSDDIIRLGRLYLNRGVWEGKRLLSEKWIDDATSFHTDNSMNGTPDWKSGYGYQIWLNAREGYRGDGAFGQLMVILPSKNMLIAVQGIVPSMQDEVDNLYTLADGLLSLPLGGTPEIPAFEPAAADDDPAVLPDAFYKLNENVFGWTMLHVYRTEDGFIMDVSNGRRISRLSAGRGAYLFSEYTECWRKPKLNGLMDAHVPETIRTAAFYTVKEGSVVITARHLCDPHTETITLHPDGDAIRVTFSCANLLAPEAKEISGTRIG